MTPLPSDTDVGEDVGRVPVAQFGVRYQLVDSDGRVLYQQVARHLIPESLEAPTGDPEGSFVRQFVNPTEGSFDIVVPVLEGARELVISRGPAEQTVRTGRVEPVFSEVLRVSLTERGPSEVA